MKLEADAGPDAPPPPLPARRSAKKGGSPTLDRIPLLFNTDIAMLYVEPDESDEHFYRNAQADEVVYVAKGKGVLEIAVRRSAVSAKATTSSSTAASCIATGSTRRATRRSCSSWRAADTCAGRSAIATSSASSSRARRTRERDIRRPARARHARRDGRLPHPRQAVRRHQRDRCSTTIRSTSSAGTATSIRGRSTSTTSSRSSAACTSRRRCTRRSRATASSSARSARGRTTFDPNAVPAPYNHSNVDSDEVLYYASSEFMSRKGIEFGSITHHPDGIPHGPHPGRAEASIGAKYTNELAVMMDTLPAAQGREAGARRSRIPKYHRSWVDAQHDAFNPPTS